VSDTQPFIECQVSSSFISSALHLSHSVAASDHNSAFSCGQVYALMKDW